MGLKTEMTHLARPVGYPASVNMPIVRTSTVLFESVEQMDETKSRRAQGERLFSYGRRGTPTTFALEDAVSALEKGEHTQLLPSGVAAINLVFMTLLKPGDHVIIADCVYKPLRNIVQQWLIPWGVEVSYFDGSLGALQAALRPNTRLIYTEVPGSLVYEMQDLPSICALADQHDIPVVVDNTWASGVLMQPLTHGATVSLMAGTKYLVGHSDAMLGTVTANGEVGLRLKEMAATIGQCIGADDAYLAIRGLRTLPWRLEAHANQAQELGDWLIQKPGVATIHQPSRAEHPGHHLWQRDFSGTNGLLTVEFMQNITAQQVIKLVNSLGLFGIGSSWGGFESLALPCDVASSRSLTNDWHKKGPLLRLHVGLEDVNDLKNDLNVAWGEIKA